MRAMILAAGRGERLKPLTNTCPKPLIPVRGKPLIVYHLEKLAACGITDVVINLAYLGEHIQTALGDGSAWGLRIQYSLEHPVKETGGGIFQALPLLGNEPFMLLSADIWTDYPFEQLPMTVNGLGHLVMVDNPAYHSKGDFHLSTNGLLSSMSAQAPSYTYANIAILHPDLFLGCEPGSAFKLGPLLHHACEKGLITGEHYSGKWVNVGTVDELNSLEYSLLNPSQVT